MSAQEYASELHAEVTQIQTTLFHMPRINEGAVTLTSIRNIPIPHHVTAGLTKSEDMPMGIGRKVVIVSGRGEITGFSYKDGRLVWTVSCEDVEVAL